MYIIAGKLLMHEFYEIVRTSITKALYMEKILFDSWSSLIRTGVITVLAYILLIILLRVSGKRTLSKMSAYDFIVTIALGSTLATVMLNKDVALADGVLAFFLLIFLQYCITWVAVRNKAVSNLVKSSPALLVYKGEFLKSKMLEERIEADEIYAIVRKNGLSTIKDADAIVLETDGTLSLIKHVESLHNEAMKKVVKPTEFI
jgi:uncharacterized membrane protein YcaP (DUF421 family)